MNSPKIVSYLLYAKGLIWIGLSIFYFINQVSPNPNVVFQVVAFLLVTNAVIYFLLGYFWKRTKGGFMFWLTIAFVLSNVVLTVTDQMGVLDILSLITDVLVLFFIIFLPKPSTSI